MDEHDTSYNRMLEAEESDEPGELNNHFQLVYDELKHIAHHQRMRWNGDFTLNTTGIVHQAYLKLAKRPHTTWNDRPHFLAVASKAMRQILVNYARDRRAVKRGGSVKRISLEEGRQAVESMITMSDEQADTLIVLDDALKRLAKIDERQKNIVECRVYGGMTILDTAAALEISPATVKRGWIMAQAWLFEQVKASRVIKG